MLARPSATDPNVGRRPGPSMFVMWAQPGHVVIRVNPGEIAFALAGVAMFAAVIRVPITSILLIRNDHNQIILSVMTATRWPTPWRRSLTPPQSTRRLFPDGIQLTAS
jgi:hypothetical protein